MKKFSVLVALSVFCLGLVVGCDDSSSASGDNGSGGNRGGVPDTVETFMELSDYDCGKSQKCVATYLTEYHDMAVCDGDNGWVIGTLIEKMDCDFSSSSAKVIDKVSEPAEGSSSSVEKGQPDSDAKSSDSKDSPSSAGTSTKSSNSNTSGNDAKSSSSAGKEVSSSSEEMKSAWDYLNSDINYGEFTDERDGQVYKTVKIGGQVWMAENLNYAYTGVPFDNGNYTSDSTSWCYDNAPANCAKYGRLYTWAAAMDSVGEWSTNGKGCGLDNTCSVASAGSATLVRGICPKGWHLPSNDEWKDLIVAVDGSITEYTSSNTAGSKLKSQTGWTASSGITNEDAFGFSALPAGYRGNGGDYYSEGNDARFWSSTVSGSYYAYFMELYFYIDSASLYNNSKCNGFSVRCLKDSE